MSMKNLRSKSTKILKLISPRDRILKKDQLTKIFLQTMSAPLRNLLEWAHLQSRQDLELSQWKESMSHSMSHQERKRRQDQRHQWREFSKSQKIRSTSLSMNLSWTNSTKKQSTERESIRWQSRDMKSTTARKRHIFIQIWSKNEHDWIRSCIGMESQVLKDNGIHRKTELISIDKRVLI